MFELEATDYKNNKFILELENIAFLVGNGINRHKECEYTWESLLKETLPKDISNHLDKQNTEEDSSLKGLSYPEIAELAFLLRSNECNSNINNIKDFKSEIVKKVMDIEEKFTNEKHNQLISFANKNNCPILTTNYDKSFLKTDDLDLLKTNNNKLRWLLKKGDKNKKDTMYLTNAYFCKNRINMKNKDTLCKTFAIWYIHGIAISKSYNNSIKITNKDYGDSIFNLKKYINILKKNNDDIFNGYNTWINIIMNNDLIIAGLGLEQSETDLRWMLVERFIYHKNKEKKANEEGILYKRPETVFIYSNEIPKGTKIFFDSLGIKFVRKNYEDVFDFEKYVIKIQKNIY